MVLLPYYKSFSDALVLLYTYAAHGIEVPFTVGNFEDSPKVQGIQALVKGTGYIKARRSRDQSLQEGYINMAMIREILCHDKLLTVF